MSNKPSIKVRPAKRGRGRGGPNFIQIYRYVLDSPAYISLSTPGKAALIEVNHAYNGSNNGRIILSVRQLAQRMNCSINTAMRALQELTDKGFIEPRVKGAFSLKFRRATEWRLNDRHCDVTGQEQSQAFLKWQNPAPESQPKFKTRSQNLRPYGLKIEDTGNFGREPGRSQNLRHSRAFHGLKNEDTSISTISPVLKGAPAAAGLEVEVVAGIGHNAGPPLDDDGLGIPTFLLRGHPDCAVVD